MEGARNDAVDGIARPTPHAPRRQAAPGAALIALLAAAAPATAALHTLHFDVSGISSIGTSDYPGSPGSSNTSFLIDAANQLGLPSGTPLMLTGVGWDLTMTAFDGARLGDMRVWITHPSHVGPPPNPPLGGWFFIAPASGFNFNSGTDSFQTEVADLEGPPIEFPDGMLYLEFWDWFDQIPDAPDGHWDSGVVSLQFFSTVPSPGALPLLALGALGARRRRMNGQRAPARR